MTKGFQISPSRAPPPPHLPWLISWIMFKVEADKKKKTSALQTQIPCPEYINPLTTSPYNFISPIAGLIKTLFP